MSQLITYYLEMTTPEALQAKTPPENFAVNETQVKDFVFNRDLYQLIGQEWGWVDRLAWSETTWREYVENDNLRTWVAYCKGVIAGYYELQQQAEGNVEIVYFGLAPKFIGKGLGGYLLSQAVSSAWQWSGTKRVWLHTCSLDHENALKNYRARGFKLYKTEQE